MSDADPRARGRAGPRPVSAAALVPPRVGTELRPYPPDLPEMIGNRRFAGAFVAGLKPTFRSGRRLRTRIRRKTWLRQLSPVALHRGHSATGLLG